MKTDKLTEMLKNMSDYSSKQPKVIEKLCNDLFISPSNAPVTDLLVEAFLTVYSFSILMFEGLISNASAILRILIEQVSAISVIANNPRVMTEYLIFQTWKKQYYSSLGDERKRLRNFLFQKSGYRGKNEAALREYLDYGWIRVLNDDKNERGERLIIKEAHLDEFIVDINEQLNAFAHGQRSIFEFINNKDLADKHLFRIIMIAGKLFLFLCNAKQKLLVNEGMSRDEYFNSYLSAKILFLDLNARSTSERIIDLIKTSNNLDMYIMNSLSMIDHMRGLIYQSELNYNQVNFVANAYVLNLKNFMYMISYKMFAENDEFFVGVDSFSDLMSKVGLDKIEPYYSSSNHDLILKRLIELLDSYDENWKLMKGDRQMDESIESFLTDTTSLIHSMFEKAYPNIKSDELIKTFVPIDNC